MIFPIRFSNSNQIVAVEQMGGSSDISVTYVVGGTAYKKPYWGMDGAVSRDMLIDELHLSGRTTGADMGTLHKVTTEIQEFRNKVKQRFVDIDNVVIKGVKLSDFSFVQVSGTCGFTNEEAEHRKLSPIKAENFEQLCASIANAIAWECTIETATPKDQRIPYVACGVLTKDAVSRVQEVWTAFNTPIVIKVRSAEVGKTKYMIDGVDRGPVTIQIACVDKAGDMRYYKRQIEYGYYESFDALLDTLRATARQPDAVFEEQSETLLRDLYKSLDLGLEDEE